MMMKMLSCSIAVAAGLALATADDEPKAGDIVLKINPKFRAGRNIRFPYPEKTP